MSNLSKPRSLVLLAAVALLLVMAGAWVMWRRAGHREPRYERSSFTCADCNLLLISVDTLRADRLSTYGYTRPTSPHLTDLARDGVLFEHFYHSGGGTLESHMSMLTSLNPLTHDVGPDNGRALEEQRVTLAEQLKAAGFATAAFVDDGWLLAKFGFGQGFDVYDESGGRFEMILPRAHQWLTAQRQGRFFLFVHTYDVHSEFNRLPYECPGDYPWRYASRPSAGSFDGCRDGRCASELFAWVNEGIRKQELAIQDVLPPEEVAFASSLYDGCVNYVDARIADLLGALRALGHYDRTLVVVTSDHGEEFGEHGMLLHEQGGYEELSHIPLILKLPDSRFAGRRVPQLGAMVDLMPTLLDILDVPVHTQAQGRSLMPAVAVGRSVRQEVHMYDVLATDTWKYFLNKHELYEYRTDAREETNVYGAKPDVVKDLSGRLLRLIQGDERARDSFRSGAANEKTITLSPEEEQRLRSLGYLR